MWFSIACYVRPAGYSIHPPILINCGLPKVAHEARTDFSRVMGALCFCRLTRLRAGVKDSGKAKQPDKSI
jgi:hypothetical protein